MKSAFSYDTMPYPSKFFLQTHPNRLATIGTFYGMDPPKIDTCRLLDLGCGNGSNLIAHAFRLPDAEFVGVDLSGKHIEHAKETAETLEISNIDFRETDVLEMSVEEFGKFDYIIAHGLFSWVPETVREKALALCREMLAENGVGYISYNAFPGAHYRKMVREMMLYETKDSEEPLEKVGKAITFLTDLTENATDKDVYQPILENELERHFEHDAADIFHDDLAEFYQPFYFHEFAKRLEANDLQFLAEAELHSMSLGTLPPKVRDFIESHADIIDREQYSDFYRGRTFRQTLFCHKNIELKRDFGLDSLDQFMIASSLKPATNDPEIATQKPQRFVGAKGVGIEIDHPLTKAALFHLGEVWGKAVPFAELLKEAAKVLEGLGNSVENLEKEATTTSAILTQIATGTDLVELHLYQPRANQVASESPKIDSLARWQLQEASNVSTLLNLDLKIEDEVSRQLLKLMDGTRDKEILKQDMTEFIKTDERIDDKQDLLNNLESWIEDSIDQLAKLGIFVN